jgi:hypothetical protein
MWDRVTEIAETTHAQFPEPSTAPLPDANQRRLASIDLNRAVRDGRVVKPAKCEQCGTEPGTNRDDCLHGHHTDYRRPLDVTWLCRGCHMEKHRQYYGRMD